MDNGHATLNFAQLALNRLKLVKRLCHTQVAEETANEKDAVEVDLLHMICERIFIGKASTEAGIDHPWTNSWVKKFIPVP